MRDKHEGLNPFQYGRELNADELVDRERELEEIERTVRNRGKLFLIGPRRFGKTSLLSAAAERAQAAGVVVLRLDAEKYETLPLLAQALLTAAVRGLEGPVDRAAALIGRVAARLRPEVVFDPGAQSWTVTVGVQDRPNALPLLADALDTVEQLALEGDREVCVMLDEVQQIVIEHGLAAEKQVRATVQRHARTSYVFAGSAVRLLNELTSAPNRPFYRLGGRIFLERLPRGALIAQLQRGFSSVTAEAPAPVCEHLIDRAADVPYNVQRLAYEVWERLRSGEANALTVEAVDSALGALVRREDAAYTQLWTSLTLNQKKTLRMVVASGGVGLLSARLAQAHGIAVPSVQRALGGLLERELIRPEQTAGESRYVLVDPFVADWLARFSS